MIVTIDVIQFLKESPNSAYKGLKKQFLFHSNKIEGSSFTWKEFEKAVDQNIIEGLHKLDDVYETMNSIKLFDFVIETLKEPLTKRLIQEYHGKRFLIK